LLIEPGCTLGGAQERADDVANAIVVDPRPNPSTHTLTPILCHRPLGLFRRRGPLTTTAQLEANRATALRSTGPRTEVGKARSARNATTHGLTAKMPVAVRYGPFVEDAAQVQAFVEAVVAELDPRTTLELAEVQHLAGLYLRRSRLVELEALALAHNSQAEVLPPAGPGRPSRITEPELQRAGSQALSGEFFDRLPRYEGHLGREIDRSRARYARMQAERHGKEQALVGELVGEARTHVGWSSGPRSG